MAIIIKNEFSVLEYKPLVPTYAIRIRDCEASGELRPLVDSPLFRKINVYRIDDCQPDAQGRGPVPEGTAEQLIKDFSSAMFKFADIRDILIHCNEGKARSPATGGALNEVFNLGYETWRIYADFPKCNEHVYNQIVLAARLMGIPPIKDRIKLFDSYANAE